MRGKTARRLRQAAARLWREAHPKAPGSRLVPRRDGFRYVGPIRLYRDVKKWWKGAPHGEKRTVFR